MRAHHRFLSLEIRGSNYYSDCTLPFADGLNNLIGGRGVGKSGILYFLRFLADCPVPAATAKEFDDYIKGVLGAGTVVARILTLHGVEYTVTRCYGEAPKVHDADGKLVDVSLDGELFRVVAYGPKAIEAMAFSASMQLELIDSFAPAEMRRFALAIAEVEQRIVRRAEEADRLTAEIEADEAREAELPSVTEALKGLALGDADAQAHAELTRAQERRITRGREHLAMTQLSAEVARTRDALDTFAREAQRRLASAVQGDLERSPEPFGPIFRRAHEEGHRAAGAVETAAGRLRDDLARVEQAIAVEGRALAAVHDAEDEAYKALVVRQDADRERAVERERLHRRLEELSALARRMEERRRERDEKLAEHAALMGARSALFKERFEVRCRIGREITEAVEREVDVTLKRGGDTTRFHALLQDVFERLRVNEALVAKIAEEIPPDELVALVAGDDEAAVAAIVAVDPIKTGKEGRALKVLQVLRGCGRLREIEMVAPEDMPLLRLKVNGEYQPLDQVSTGQRCTATLPLLLLPSPSTLLIDQVEDHLDNAFVSNVFVPTLLAAKKSRQFIFVSHNPNIVVLAESDRVFEMATVEAHGRPAAFGDVEEMREACERVLEGGRDAFLKRGERYGHLPKRQVEGDGSEGEED